MVFFLKLCTKKTQARIHTIATTVQQQQQQQQHLSLHAGV